MKVIVAGQDRSGDLGAEVQTAAGARAHPAPERLATAARMVRDLKNAGSEGAFLEAYLGLLRTQRGLDTSPFSIPGRGGAAAAAAGRLKAFLWRLLRYQHDRMAFQQNTLNALVAGALEFENDALRRDVQRLEQRVAELERAVLKPAGAGGERPA